MVIMIKYFAALLSTGFILISFNGSLYAQNKKLEEYNTHGKRYFMKLKYSRLNDILLKATKQQETEKNTVARLKAKNDSLIKAGGVYDTVSVDVTQRLGAWNNRIDSVNKIIQGYQKDLKRYGTYRRKHVQLENSITNLGESISANAPVHASVFKGIDVQLDTSNLSGEKAKLAGILNSASTQQEKEAAIIGAIDNRKDSILKEGKVDSSVSGKIDVRLNNYKQKMDSIAGEITGLQEKLNSPKELSKDFTLIKTKILIIDSVVNKNAIAREYVFQMIDEGLTKSTPHPFSLAAFFGPGGFKIPGSKYDLAKTYFSPVIDSLIKFSNNYASVMRTASIIVNGYADAANISKGSTLYRTLSKYLNTENPTKQELNTALSALRAEEISKLLTKILKERFPDFMLIDRIVFEAIETGQGEKFPDPLIKNYKDNDERRRIVVIFWNVLPAE